MEILVCVLLTAIAGHMVWSAVRVWHDPDRARAEARQWNRLGLGERGAWVVIRGFVPVAAMFSCLAFMMITEVAADALSPVRGPLATAGGVFLIVMLACWLVIASIAVFNRPRFLVPPHLRDKRRL